MIRNFHVITKGMYEKEQTNERLHIDRFLVVRKNRRRFLLLDLLNKSSETLVALKLQIEQFDGRGNPLGETEHEFKRLEVKTGKSILKKRIELFPTCMDFKVNVLYARYGNFFYCYGEEGNYVTFEKTGFGKKLDKAEIQRRVGKDGQVKGKRRFTFPIFVSIFSAVVMLVSAGVAMAHLFSFKQNRNDFFLQNIKYEIIGDANATTSPIYVAGYIGAGGEEIVIPAKVDEHPVIGIAEGAFQGNSVIKKVTVEEGITVSRNAFRDCFRLETVELLGNNIVSQYAFADCTRLSNISLKNTTQVDIYAFRGAMNVSNLTITSATGQMPNIHYTAFNGCENFDNVHVDAYINYTQGYMLLPSARTIDSLHLKNFNYTGYMTEGSDVSIASAFGSYVNIQAIEIDYMDEIPAYFADGLESSLESVKVKNITTPTIGQNAFIDCARLKKVDLGKAITEIGSYAFARTGLESFSATALTSMGAGAFEACTQLKSVDLSACSALKDIPMGAFAGCGELSTAKLPTTAVSIGVSAFEACESIKNITLPTSLQVIDSGAFSKCYNLRYISLPSELTALGTNAFANCYRLYEIENLSSDVTIPEGESENRYTLKVYTSQEEPRIYKETANGCTIAEVGDFYYLVDFDITQKELLLPMGRSIVVLPYTFYKENSIEKITFPDNVRYVRDYAFMESGVKEVVFSGWDSDLYWTVNTFKGMNSLEHVNFGQRRFDEIYDATFEGFYSLKTIRVSPYVNKIGNRAFLNCNQLETVTGCSQLESIGTEAFMACGNLRSVETGYSLQTIKDSAFRECYSLKEINLPYGLTTIGNHAFNACSSLEEMAFPYSLSSIGSYAFAFCSALESVSLPYSLSSIGSEAFIGCNQLHEVYDLSPWLAIEKDSMGYGYVGYNALEIFTWEYDWMEEITVGDYEFKYSNYGRWYLVGYNGWEDKITLGAISDSACYVDRYEVARYAFDGCSAGTLVIGSGVTAIRSQAFNSMWDLNWLIFENNRINTLPAYAFSGCEYLRNVVIPTNLVSIEANAISSYWVNVYYTGTREGWNYNKSNYALSFSSVYYYDACAHENDEWKYTNGYVDTSNKEYKNQIVISQATCSKNGSAIRVCPDCGESITETLWAYGHSFSDWNSGKCYTCGYVKDCFVNQNTLSLVSGVMSIENIGAQRFDIFNSGYSNISISSTTQATAVLKIKAKTAIKISFYAECYGSGSSMNVTANGSSLVVKNDNRKFEYYLNANAEIIITYVNSGTLGIGNAMIYSMNVSSQNDPSL